MTGGDPLSKENTPDTLRLVEKLKKQFPNKNVWVYTGALWESLCQTAGVELIDVVVDGEYADALKSPDKHWVGSSNQNVIDVKASLAEDKLVLWREE